MPPTAGFGGQRAKGRARGRFGRRQSPGDSCASLFPSSCTSCLLYEIGRDKLPVRQARIMTPPESLNATGTLARQQIRAKATVQVFHSP
jgi:hypothetical protein